ncbi:MAG: hypothetical protein Q9170_002297 [Blastenia crenularia]
MDNPHSIIRLLRLQSNIDRVFPASQDAQGPSQDASPFFHSPRAGVVATEHQLGPLSSAVPLCTHNSTQPPHIPRLSPPHSISLLRQLLRFGSVANAWADLYPFIHWSSTTDNPEESASRRLLTEHERHRLRRACYRIWLYSLAYHHSTFSRHSRHQPATVRLRAALLRAWPTIELDEISDLQGTIRKVVQCYICPSNGTIIRRHKERYGEDIIAALDPCSSLSAKSSRIIQRLVYIKEGWGGDVDHYYVVEDMLKLHPGQIMELYEYVNRCETDGTVLAGFPSTGSNKLDVEAYTGKLGEWFDSNGQTLGETLKVVLSERGEEEILDEGAIVADG